MAVLQVLVPVQIAVVITVVIMANSFYFDPAQRVPTSVNTVQNRLVQRLPPTVWHLEGKFLCFTLTGINQFEFQTRSFEVHVISVMRPLNRRHLMNLPLSMPSIGIKRIVRTVIMMKRIRVYHSKRNRTDRPAVRNRRLNKNQIVVHPVRAVGV